MLNLDINNRTGVHTIQGNGDLMELCSDFIYGIFAMCYHIQENTEDGAEMGREMRDCIAAAIQSDDLFKTFKPDEVKGYMIIKEEAQA